MSPASVPQPPPPPPQPPVASGGKIETVLIMAALAAIGGAAITHPDDARETKLEKLTKVSVGFAAASFALLLLDQVVPQIAYGMALLMLAAVLLYYGSKKNPRGGKLYLTEFANSLFGG